MNSTLNLDFVASNIAADISPRHLEILRERPKLCTSCMISVEKTFKENTNVTIKELKIARRVDITKDFSVSTIQTTISDILHRFRRVDSDNDVIITVEFMESTSDFIFHKSSVTIKESVLHELDLESLVVYVKGILSPTYYWLDIVSDGTIFPNILARLGESALTTFLKAINDILPGSFNYYALYDVIVYLTTLVYTGRIYATTFKSFGGYFKEDPKYLQVVVNGNIRMKNDYFTIEFVKDSMGFLLYKMDELDDVLVNDIEHLERNVVFKD